MMVNSIKVMKDLTVMYCKREAFQENVKSVKNDRDGIVVCDLFKGPILRLL